MPVILSVKLNIDGTLEPCEAPIIPSELLNPIRSSSTTHIGTPKQYDEFLSKNQFESVQSWPELLAYIKNMLNAVAGTTELSEIDPDYTNFDQSILILEEKVRNTRDAIQNIYNDIIDGAEPSNLYHALTKTKPCKLKQLLSAEQHEKLYLQHLAQMTGEFSLSPKQRIALNYYLHGSTVGDEPILAINGPPGTGKTTLIRSVVANLWVEKAIEGNEPPIIVATSNNNQAITNILDSFANIDEHGLPESLLGRWLPDLSTYGLYCCSKDRGGKSHYAYYEADNSGLFQHMQTQAYINKAKHFYLKAYNTYSGGNENGIKNIVDLLHKLILVTKNEIDLLIKEQASFSKLISFIDSEYTNVQNLIASASLLEEELAAAKEKSLNIFKLLKDFRQEQQNRSFFKKYLAWLPSFKKSIVLDNTIFISENSIDINEATDDMIVDYLSNQMRRWQVQQKEINVKLSEQKKTLDAYNNLYGSLKNKIEANNVEFDATSCINKQVENVADTKLRFKAFKLATHYWEGRWLIETEKFVSMNDADKKSPVKVLRKWRRFAKLTPCLVSTFYMLPKYFTCLEKKDDSWKDIYLYNAIDLLIIDEAGQANPEVAATSFAVSKRAVVVGDTEQIEPIWAVHSSTDRASLAHFELLSDENEHDYTKIWLESGLLASSGNLMRVAQQQTPYHQFEELRRGIYLTEHRRCYNNIIAYCNDLVYKGFLEPMRGEAPENICFPSMGFIHSEGDSKKQGGSRINKRQAEEMLAWLSRHASIIIESARSNTKKLHNLNDEEVLIKAVAIVTPFVKQAYVIRNMLKSHNLPIGMTVGTVHALQGSERDIILFSSVYGQSDTSSAKFYDSGNNMLNVAVSRAKNNFIVFGHEDVFGNNAKGTASGLLMPRLVDISS